MIWGIQRFYPEKEKLNILYIFNTRNIESDLE
jgi:hypothetical protein